MKPIARVRRFAATQGEKPYSRQLPAVLRFTRRLLGLPFRTRCRTGRKAIQVRLSRQGESFEARMPPPDGEPLSKSVTVLSSGAFAIAAGTLLEAIPPLTRLDPEDLLDRRRAETARGLVTMSLVLRGLAARGYVVEPGRRKSWIGEVLGTLATTGGVAGIRLDGRWGWVQIAAVTGIVAAVFTVLALLFRKGSVVMRAPNGEKLHATDHIEGTSYALGVTGDEQVHTVEIDLAHVRLVDLVGFVSSRVEAELDRAGFPAPPASAETVPAGAAAAGPA